MIVRPLGVGTCLAPVKVRRNERAFVLFAGLKGAVPILVGEFLRAAHVPQAERLYGIVVVVVAFSVLLQGSLVPVVARVLNLPMRTAEPEPWAIGVRLRDEPQGVRRLTVCPGSAAEGTAIADLGERVGDIWVSIVVRESRVVILAEPAVGRTLTELFAATKEPNHHGDSA